MRGTDQFEHDYSRVVGATVLTWNVQDLWRLVAHLDSFQIRLNELNKSGLFGWLYEKNSKNDMEEHLKKVMSADLSFPIILCPDGKIMDGCHRLLKAYALGNTMIRAKKFLIMPAPTQTYPFIEVQDYA